MTASARRSVTLLHPSAHGFEGPVTACNLLHHRHGAVTRQPCGHYVITLLRYYQCRPHIDDVHQGRLGDCYFAGALILVAKYDPRAIEDAITQVSPADVC